MEITERERDEKMSELGKSNTEEKVFWLQRLWKNYL